MVVSRRMRLESNTGDANHIVPCIKAFPPPKKKKNCFLERCISLPPSPHPLPRLDRPRQSFLGRRVGREKISFVLGGGFFSSPSPKWLATTGGFLVGASPTLPGGHSPGCAKAFFPVGGGGRRGSFPQRSPAGRAAAVPLKRGGVFAES